ncbi:MAG: hypothetical protein ACO3UU_15940 [Minisyncoccia bacterium]
MSPIGVWSVYKTLPSLVIPPLTVKSPTASVQIDSSINGDAISATASSAPFIKPLSIVSPSFVEDIISLAKVLNGLAIKSYALE